MTASNSLKTEITGFDVSGELSLSVSRSLVIIIINNSVIR